MLGKITASAVEEFYKAKEISLLSCKTPFIRHANKNSLNPA
jgi:hypothetical protein